MTATYRKTSAGSVRRRSGKQTSLPTRRGWLRGLAIALGVAVLLAHIYTFPLPHPLIPWLALNLPDVVKHFLMLAAFSLAYRLSWAGGEAGAGLSPGVATVLYCGGWGALCEVLQIWMPTREFSPLELGVNVGAALAVVGLVSALHPSSFRPQ
jgi:VanZ family protein